MTIKSSIWLGSELGLQRVLQAQMYALQHPDQAAAARQLYAGWDDDDDDDDKGDVPTLEDEFDSYLIQVSGSVGIININGPMVAEDSWWNRMFGLVSYAEIARALQELALHDAIESIMLNLDTPGGESAGIEGASETVAWAKDLKPVHTHTSGGMLSAGYWLGAMGTRVSSTKMGESGSVGVIIVHRSVYEALKEQGIEYTVIRAGKYKALGHPSEKLSEEAQALLQKEADTMYSFFLEHVSTYRPSLSISTKETWAEGKKFFGGEARQLGLVDEVNTLSVRVEALDTVDKQLQDSNNARAITLEDTAMPEGKPVLLRSPKDKAALESGAALEDLEVVEESDTVQALADSAKELLTDLDPKASDKGGEPAIEDGGKGVKPETGADLVAYLKEQNATLTAVNATLSAEKAALEAKVSDSATDMASLKEIVISRVHAMQIALNSEPLDLNDMPVATVVAQHGKVRKSFEERYKIAQQSRPMATEAGDRESDVNAYRHFGIVPKS